MYVASSFRRSEKGSSTKLCTRNPACLKPTSCWRRNAAARAHLHAFISGGDDVAGVDGCWGDWMLGATGLPGQAAPSIWQVKGRRTVGRTARRPGAAQQVGRSSSSPCLQTREVSSWLAFQVNVDGEHLTLAGHERGRAGRLPFCALYYLHALRTPVRLTLIAAQCTSVSQRAGGNAAMCMCAP